MEYARIKFGNLVDESEAKKTKQDKLVEYACLRTYLQQIMTHLRCLPGLQFQFS